MLDVEIGRFSMQSSVLITTIAPAWDIVLQCSENRSKTMMIWRTKIENNGKRPRLILTARTKWRGGKERKREIKKANRGRQTQGEMNWKEWLFPIENPCILFKTTAVWQRNTQKEEEKGKTMKLYTFHQNHFEGNSSNCVRYVILEVQFGHGIYMSNNMWMLFFATVSFSLLWIFIYLCLGACVSVEWKREREKKRDANGFYRPRSSEPVSNIVIILAYSVEFVTRLALRI